MELLSNLLDMLFYKLIVPVFTLIATGLELVLLEPMRLVQLPPAAQVVAIAVLCACLSLLLRKLMKVEEKEREFKEQFTAKKKQQEDLHLISDWKSREKFAKAMDDDIDEDFNTYLAGRFARYGTVYLLPLFLVLYWLENAAGYSIVIDLPGRPFGLEGIPSLVVFLFGYCLSLFLFFRVRKRKIREPELTASTV